eukprot:6473905-Amphidinium_carterae.5
MKTSAREEESRKQKLVLWTIDKLQVKKNKLHLGSECFACPVVIELSALCTGVGQPKPAQVDKPDIHFRWIVKGHCHDWFQGGLGGACCKVSCTCSSVHVWPNCVFQAAIQDGDCRRVTDERGRERYSFHEEQIGEEKGTSSLNEAVRRGPFTEEDFGKAKELVKNYGWQIEAWRHIFVLHFLCQIPMPAVSASRPLKQLLAARVWDKLGEIHAELQKVLAASFKVQAECKAYMQDWHCVHVFNSCNGEHVVVLG